MDAQFALYQRTPQAPTQKATAAAASMSFGKPEGVTSGGNNQNRHPVAGEKFIEIRKLLNEQNAYPSHMAKHLDSDSLEDLELPARRYTPLPDIPRSDDVYFRTESRLMKDTKELTSSNNIVVQT